jgi:multidrug efflux system membrane fusion protein
MIMPPIMRQNWRTRHLAATFSLRAQGCHACTVDGLTREWPSSSQFAARCKCLGSRRGELELFAPNIGTLKHHLSLAVVTIPLLTGCKKQNAFVQPPPPQVGVARPLPQEVTPYLELTGNAQAVNQVDLVARVQGFLQAIDYQDGASAKQGDTLFVIEPTPYEARLQQAQASLAATQAQLTQSQVEFNRQASLGRSDFSSQSSVDQARATRDTNQANLGNQQAAVTQAAINLGYTRVTAPFDGQVTAHQVSVGSLVGVTGPTTLATIIQLDPIRVLGTVSEQDVLRIKETMAKKPLGPSDVANVPIEVGLMNEAGYPHHGNLDYVAPALDTSTGTLTIRGVLANADRALLPGMFVRMRIPLTRQKALSLLVPDLALGSDQGGRYLLVVDKDNVVQQRPVMTGQLVGDLRVIASGVAAEDRVVVVGLQKAIPGATVVPNEAVITGQATGGRDR